MYTKRQLQEVRGICNTYTKSVGDKEYVNARGNGKR